MNDKCPKCGDIDIDLMRRTIVTQAVMRNHYKEMADALEAENARLRDAIKNHHDQHADDLCWMDDDELYAAAGLPARHATTGDPKAMLRNCKRFIRQRCQGEGDWKSYAELEAENARLKQWDDEQKQVLIAMATKVYLAGYKGDGLVDGVKWLADENARLRKELEAKN